MHAEELLHDVELRELAVPEVLFPGWEIRSYRAINSRIAHYTGKDRDEHDPLVYAILTLFATKLSDRPLPRFTAFIGSVVEGTLFYDESEALSGMKEEGNGIYSENIQMIGAHVRLHPLDLFPLRTGSYSPLAYVDEANFRKMVRLKSSDPVAHLFGENSLMYCVKGMCLQAAHIAL